MHDWGGHDGPVRSLSWARDGTVLATCSDDGSARLWAAVPSPPLGCIARPAAATTTTAQTAQTAQTASAAAASSAPQSAAAAQAGVAEEAGSSVVIDELEVELKDLQVRPLVEYTMRSSGCLSHACPQSRFPHGRRRRFLQLWHASIHSAGVGGDLAVRAVCPAKLG